MSDYLKCKCGGDIRYKYIDTITVDGYICPDGYEIEEELGERGEGMSSCFDTGYRLYCDDCGKEWQSIHDFEDKKN